MAWTGSAILPCGSNANPRDTGTIEYFSPGSVVYVLQKDERTRPTRMVQSAGDLGARWSLGTYHDCYHDQTGQQLGSYRVVGIALYDLGLFVGDVPDRMLSYSVFK